MQINNIRIALNKTSVSLIVVRLFLWGYKQIIVNVTERS